MTKFSSVLVANRGEIACRVLRTLNSLGYRSVAVYSEADRSAPHPALADHAELIGPGPVNESYLCADKILAAAKRSGAQAIHPGYGFLSENAEFAEACEQAGLVFIGPSATAIRAMGNKAEAKRLMIEASVPCIPGYQGRDQTDEALCDQARQLGLPLMVKAAAGGGGRGMRLVENEDELANAIRLARAEAENAFGNGELILERAVVRPRHVEVQVFADCHGNTVYLGERDCSVQRRHQKIIEEAPCPVLDPVLRQRMGEAAVTVARSINYQGAGTVEFLLDANGEFYFLEMNTRLQVEHPVTEVITGRDLVALQLQVAQGEALGFSQQDIQWQGHAIEVRLYTEDPAQDFLPTSGEIALWHPASGEGVRIDDGIQSGQLVSPFYDPMVAKLIAWGEDRDSARRRLMAALRDSCLFGPTSNKAFLLDCLDHPEFAAARATTAFITEAFGEGVPMGPDFAHSDAAISAVLACEYDYHVFMDKAVGVSPELKNWSNARPLMARKQYTVKNQQFDLHIIPRAQHHYEVSCDGLSIDVEVLESSDPIHRLKVDGIPYRVFFHAMSDAEHYVDIEGRCFHLEDAIRKAGSSTSAGDASQVIAPMHGLLLEVRVSPGEEVRAGQTLAVLEAMKMHYEIVAEADGVLAELLETAGSQVAADSVLMRLDVGAASAEASDG